MRGRLHIIFLSCVSNRIEAESTQSVDGSLHMLAQLAAQPTFEALFYVWNNFLSISSSDFGCFWARFGFFSFAVVDDVVVLCTKRLWLCFFSNKLWFSNIQHKAQNNFMRLSSALCVSLLTGALCISLFYVCLCVESTTWHHTTLAIDFFPLFFCFCCDFSLCGFQIIFALWVGAAKKTIFFPFSVSESSAERTDNMDGMFQCFNVKWTLVHFSCDNRFHALHLWQNASVLALTSTLKRIFAWN